jgi:hypothetical protein
MNPDYIADLLGTLPTYTEATFTTMNGRTYRGIARDLPKNGRRWTVDGSEWFITAEALRNLEVVKVDINLAALEVVH